MARALMLAREQHVYESAMIDSPHSFLYPPVQESSRACFIDMALDRALAERMRNPGLVPAAEELLACDDIPIHHRVFAWCKIGHMDMVKDLLGGLPLYVIELAIDYAVMEHQFAVFAALIDRTEDNWVDAYTRDCLKVTLQRAAREGRMDFIEDILFSDYNELLPPAELACGFAGACHGGHVDIIRFFLELSSNYADVFNVSQMRRVGGERWVVKGGW